MATTILLLILALGNVCLGQKFGCVEQNTGYDGLTIQEQACTTMRNGLVRYQQGTKTLEVCSEHKWIPYDLAMRIRRGLVGHWKMDEESGNNVDDDSGKEHHGSATATTVIPGRGKFTRGRIFNSGGAITVPDEPGINFGTSSFSVAGWVKILDVKYPLTNFATRKGFGCYFGSERPTQWTPGWDTGHGYSNDRTEVCIRDHLNNKVHGYIWHNEGVKPLQLVGKWAHYIFVFDREAKKVKLYINGLKQDSEVNISSIEGSINNKKPLEFGSLYGWNTKGTYDEFRLYNIAITDQEAYLIYSDHRV